MSEWCNGRLVVAGPTSEAMRFRRLVGLPVAGLRITPLSPAANARASRVFWDDMLAGEAQYLFSEPAAPIGQGLLEKKYKFQVSAGSDDAHEHF
jgi:hypothetical protein